MKTSNVAFIVSYLLITKYFIFSSSLLECLALITIYVERGQTDEAKSLLINLDDNSPQLLECLTQNWKLFLDSMRQVSMIFYLLILFDLLCPCLYGRLPFTHSIEARELYSVTG